MISRERYLAVIGQSFTRVVLNNVARQVQEWIGTVVPGRENAIQNTNQYLINNEYLNQVFDCRPLIDTHTGEKDEKRLRESANDPGTFLRSSGWLDILIKTVNLRSAG